MVKPGSIPSDCLREVFSPEAIAQLRAVRQPSEYLKRRLSILAADGSRVSNQALKHWLQWLRATKAAWDVYLEAAFASGLLGQNDSNDLLSRLVGVDDDGFRGGMAECMVCWFLAGKMGFQVTPRPAGKGRRVLEMSASADQSKFDVEVKAPFRPEPEGVWVGDDSDLLAECLKQASDQFDNKTANVLFIVPRLRVSVFDLRVQLTKAFCVEEKITFAVDKRTGSICSPVETRLFPVGSFLNPNLPSGKPKKPNGKPAHTRVSAVVCIEEQYRESKRGGWIDHRWLVVHNPYANERVSSSVWGNCPQLIEQNGEIFWNDGHSLSH